MRRIVLIMALVLAGSSAASATAAPNPDLQVRFTLNCGTEQPLVAVHAFAPAPKPIFVLEDGRIFRVSSVALAGEQPLFFVPGLFDSAIPQLTCTFVGGLTGRLFIVTGFFTPGGP